MLVRAEDRTVDHQPFQIGVLCQRVEETIQHAALNPAVITSLYGVVAAEPLWQVTPPTARTRYPQQASTNRRYHSEDPDRQCWDCNTTSACAGLCARWPWPFEAVAMQWSQPSTPKRADGYPGNQNRDCQNAHRYHPPDAYPAPAWPPWTALDDCRRCHVPNLGGNERIKIRDTEAAITLAETERPGSMAEPEKIPQAPIGDAQILGGLPAIHHGRQTA
jgi:hypothetical protein